MATVIQVGPPRNDSERQAIAYLRDNLPTTCTVIHNFELVQSKEILEIDLAILTSHCVYVVAVKGVRGLVDIHGPKWYPEGRQPYNSPLMKGRLNAKLLKAFITDHYPAQLEMQKVYVRAAVLLTAPDVVIDDHTGIDGDDIVRLNKSLLYFQNKTNIPASASSDIRNLLPLIAKVITGNAKRPQTHFYRDWQVEERLGGNERFTEYRARHVFAGKRG